MSEIEIHGEKYKVLKEDIINHNDENIKVVFVEKNNPLKVYYDKNKDKIAKQKSDKFKERYSSDPQFRELMKAKRKENYLKKKNQLKEI